MSAESRALPSPRWRMALKRIPGVDRLAKRLFSPEFEGAWLYHQSVVGWLYEPVLRRQLPGPFRAFAGWCALQRSLWSDVVGGFGALRAAMRLRRALGLPESLRLEVGPYIVWLALDDPRFLQVPNEVRAGGETRVLHDLLRLGDTFVDVGANHGSFSIVASRIVGARGRVVAVEPQARLARLTERSLAETAPETEANVLNLALGDAPGTLRLHVPPGSSGSATLLDAVPDDSWETTEVPVQRLDDVLDAAALPGRVVLKVDVEGAEAAFLRGAREFFLDRQPILLFEVNPDRIETAGGADPLLALVRDLGYTHYTEFDTPTERLPLAEADLSHQRNVVLYPGAG
ncbi:MAG: FkbM family methyltransferase [Bacteroidota bacterium]